MNLTFYADKCSLGISEGIYNKEKGVYDLPPGICYNILLRNDNYVRVIACLKVDGKDIGQFFLYECQEISVQRPANSNMCFTTPSWDNSVGTIEATFIPEVKRVNDSIYLPIPGDIIKSPGMDDIRIRSCSSKEYDKSKNPLHEQKVDLPCETVFTEYRNKSFQKMYDVVDFSQEVDMSKAISIKINLRVSFDLPLGENMEDSKVGIDYE